MTTSTLNFVTFFLGICVALAGAGGWLALHDMDYTYSYDHASDTYPQYADGKTAYYEELSQSQRAQVDDAIAGERFRFEEKGDAPPTVVKKGDTYHIFHLAGSFDWLDRGTYAPTLVGLAGVGLVVWTARRDMG
jgi:hypothetical protein